jgi:hypothetical protein
VNNAVNNVVGNALNNAVNNVVVNALNNAVSNAVTIGIKRCHGSLLKDRVFVKSKECALICRVNVNDNVYVDSERSYNFSMPDDIHSRQQRARFVFPPHMN